MRARNIKPGFFKNDELAELDPLARILFAGLWCIADREGRLEDRPKRIKADVLPYDDCDVDALLDALADAGFILRYEAGSVGYIAILAFAKHQNPHKNEAPSSIPAPTSCDQGDTAPEQHSTSTVQAPEQHQSNPADSLIPDSLIPDTGFPTSEDRAARAVVPDSPFEIYSSFMDATGSDRQSVSPAWEKKQLAVARRLGEQGYGADKVGRCVAYMLSQSWRSAPFDLFGVEKVIGTWEAAGMPEREVHRNGKPDPNTRTQDDYQRNLAIAERVLGGGSR